MQQIISATNLALSNYLIVFLLLTASDTDATVKGGLSVTLLIVHVYLLFLQKIFRHLKKVKDGSTRFATPSDDDAEVLIHGIYISLTFLDCASTYCTKKHVHLADRFRWKSRICWWWCLFYLLLFFERLKYAISHHRISYFKLRCC